MDRSSILRASTNTNVRPLSCFTRRAADFLCIAAESELHIFGDFSLYFVYLSITFGNFGPFSAHFFGVCSILVRVLRSPSEAYPSKASTAATRSSADGLT